MNDEPITENWLRRTFPHAPESFIQRNLKRLPSVQQERSERRPLERRVPGEGSGCRRTLIHFEIHARRPLDWDNYSVKQLQDMLVSAGILPSDESHALEGRVTSHKVHTKEEEKTVVTLTEMS